jgi:hypothetical protein
MTGGFPRSGTGRGAGPPTRKDHTMYIGIGLGTLLLIILLIMLL